MSSYFESKGFCLLCFVDGWSCSLWHLDFFLTQGKKSSKKQQNCRLSSENKVHWKQRDRSVFNHVNWWTKRVGHIAGDFFARDMVNIQHFRSEGNGIFGSKALHKVTIRASFCWSNAHKMSTDHRFWAWFNPYMSYFEVFDVLIVFITK